MATMYQGALSLARDAPGIGPSHGLDAKELGPSDLCPFPFFPLPPPPNTLEYDRHQQQPSHQHNTEGDQGYQPSPLSDALTQQRQNEAQSSGGAGPTKDPRLKPRTHKRVSKTISPDPLTIHTQRGYRGIQSSKNQESWNRTSQPSDRPTISPTSHFAQGSPVRYSPPATKKGLVIERPYSFYKVASPTAPQSITRIDSPFGPPPSAPSPSHHTPVTPVPSSSPYNTQPGQNPFLPPPHLQQRHIPYSSATTASTTASVKPTTGISDPMPPVATTVTMITPTTLDGRRERSNSGRYNEDTLPRSDMKYTTSANSSTNAGTVGRQSSRGHGRPGRSNSNAKENASAQEKAGANTDSTHKPVRKGSGSDLFRIARQASDSAFRSVVGLGRKNSDKNRTTGTNPSDAQSHQPNIPHELSRAPSSSRGNSMSKVVYESTSLQ
ncbi:hypothetical protein BGZ94_007268 [Podila epigama]|nr:hypothetical protein BGZ94_007268 [Podila epigama]